MTKHFRKVVLTVHETIVKVLFDRFGVRHISQPAVGGYRPDFYLPSLHAVLEIDGRDHEDKKKAVKDRARDAYFEEQGFSVIRIRHDTFAKDIVRLIERITGQDVKVTVDFVGLV